jgi:hypothetical protein
MCLPSLNYEKKNYVQIGLTLKGRLSPFSTRINGLFMTFFRRMWRTHRIPQKYFVDNQGYAIFFSKTLWSICGKRLFLALIIRKALKTLKPKKQYEVSFQISCSSDGSISSYDSNAFMQGTRRLRSLSGKRKEHTLSFAKAPLKSYS